MIDFRKAPRRRWVRLTAIIFNVLWAALTLLSAYGGMIDPGTTSVGALALMCMPAVAGVMVILLAVNCFFYRAMAVLNLVTLLCCIGPLYTYSPVNPGAASRAEKARADSANTFTLMSYNAYQFDYYKRAYDGDSPNLSISHIAALDPDILVLQEASSLNQLSRWRFDREQLARFMERYPYRLVAEKTGLGILSKYPVDSVSVDKSSFTVSETADFACYTLTVEGRDLYIYNVHLQSIGLTPADKALYRSLMRANLDPSSFKTIRRELLGKLAGAFKLRAVQARALRQSIDSLSAPGRNVIVCGDFNDVPGCYATRTVRGSDLTDAFSHAGNGVSITYYPNYFYFRIDHIFYGGDLEALNVQRDTLRTSDHYPLMATFSWTAPATNHDVATQSLLRSNAGRPLRLP